jgi:hypothetical protein
MTNVVQQLKQIAEGTLETVKNQPKELGAEALEQLGVRPKSLPKSPKPLNSPNPPNSLTPAELAVLDKRRSEEQAKVIVQQLKREMEEGVKKARLQREQELQARRQPPRPLPEESAASSTAPLPDMTKNTPKRGGWLFGGIRGKAKSVFDSFMPDRRQGSGIGG